jgi:queuosine precursor transporter
VGEFGPLVTLRVAVASGLAFLCAQLLDIAVFNRLRAGAWWKAPFVSTLASSTLDTAIFFPVAFSAALMALEPGNDVTWAGGAVPLLGLGPEGPLWLSLAVADWGVKIAIACIALVPFRIILGRLGARVA